MPEPDEHRGAYLRQRLTELAEENEWDLVLFDGLDSCLLGVGGQYTRQPLAVYSRGLIRRQLMAEGLTSEQADEYLSANIEQLYAGPGTPIVVDDEL